MASPRSGSRTVVAAALLTLAAGISPSAREQKENSPASQLPPELRNAKVYHLSEEGRSDKAEGSLVTYKSVVYQDINFERLLLNLQLRIQPVDRDATIRKIYFQNVRVGGFPVHIETFDQEFKVSKKEAVDLPAPIKCSLVYSDLESVEPLKELVDQDKARITGESFIEVKLNTLQKIALRTKQLVIPVKFNEEVPLEMFSDSPLLKMAATKVLDILSDPSTSAAISLAKEHVAQLTRERTLSSLGRGSVYLIYCEYALRNPKTGTSEKFTQAGTGFVVSADGKLLTAKRVIQPWKFDPQIAFLMNRYHLELETKSYKLAAWPAGARVLAANGQPDFQTAPSDGPQSLQVVKTAPDRFEKTNYRDPESGESATLDLDTPAENDVALLQLRGDKFQPLALADSANSITPNFQATLIAYPYGLSQSEAAPKLIAVKATRQGAVIKLDQGLIPGESGAPLVNAEGKVLGLAGGSNLCVPIENLRGLIP